MKRPNQIIDLMMLGVLFLGAAGVYGIREVIFQSLPAVPEQTAQGKPGLNPVVAGDFVLQPNKKPTPTPTATQTSTITVTPTPTATTTPSMTFSLSSTRTLTRTFTATKTRTPTNTNTSTRSSTPTRTASATRSWTPSVFYYFPFVRYFDEYAYP